VNTRHGRECHGVIREPRARNPLSSAQKADRHKVTEPMARRISTARIVHLIEMAY
jgi:hypothetical protein